MYKNNSRNSSKIKGCSPLYLSCNLTGKYPAIGYYSYANRCASAAKQSHYKKENDPNFCNTNFVSIGGNRLGISYDAGRPFEIDPQTLEVRTPIGGNHEWRSALPKIAGFVSRKWPFKLLRATAHPYFDQQTGEFFSVNFDTSINTALGTFGSTFLNIMKWDGKTDIKAWQVLDIKGKPIRIKEAVHSICITRHHIIIIDTPFSLEIEQLLGSKVHRAPASRTPFTS